MSATHSLYIFSAFNATLKLRHLCKRLRWSHLDAGSNFLPSFLKWFLTVEIDLYKSLVLDSMDVNRLSKTGLQSSFQAGRPLFPSWCSTLKWFPLWTRIVPKLRFLSLICSSASLDFHDCLCFRLAVCRSTVSSVVLHFRGVLCAEAAPFVLVLQPSVALMCWGGRREKKGNAERRISGETACWVRMSRVDGFRGTERSVVSRAKIPPPPVERWCSVIMQNLWCQLTHACNKS